MIFPIISYLMDLFNPPWQLRTQIQFVRIGISQIVGKF